MDNNHSKRALLGECDDGGDVNRQLVAPSPTRIDALVTDLRHLCREAAVDLSLQIGRHIVVALFGGSVERWKTEGTRYVGYRELAQHPDLPMSASALCRAVGIYVLCHDLGGRRDWKNVGTGHFQEVLPLPFSDQRRLIHLAESEGWTVKQLRQEASKLRPQGESRKRHQRLARTIRDVKAFLAKQYDVLRSARAESLDHATAGELRETIAILDAHREVLGDALNAYEERSRGVSAGHVSETRIVAIGRESVRALAGAEGRKKERA